MSTITKDLGVVTAYGYYKAGGGTMTEAEFTQFMVDFGTASKTAVDAAEAALESERAAKESEETATSKASEAGESATTASTKAGEAAQSASEANTAKEDAVTAKTAAETAQGKAEDAQAAAESVAESIPSDYSQLSEDVSDLKENLTALGDNLISNTEHLMSDQYIDLFDKNDADFLTGKGYSGASGTIVADTQSCLTGYIPVVAGEVVKIYYNYNNTRENFFTSQVTPHKIGFYNSAKEWEKTIVDFSGYSSGELLIEQTGYIRIHYYWLSAYLEVYKDSVKKIAVNMVDDAMSFGGFSGLLLTGDNINWLDPYSSDYLVGYGYSGDSSSIVENSSYHISNYIRVYNGKTVSIPYSDGTSFFTSLISDLRKIAFYDLNKTWTKTISFAGNNIPYDSDNVNFGFDGYIRIQFIPNYTPVAVNIADVNKIGSKFLGENGQKAKWYAIGDSITDGRYSFLNSNNNPVSGTDHTAYYGYIVGKYLNLEVIEHGYSGMGYVARATDNTALTDVLGLDFDNPSLITVCLGINDCNAVTGDENSTALDGTFSGAVRNACEVLGSKYPNAQIVFLTPINANLYGTQGTAWARKASVNNNLDAQRNVLKHWCDVYNYKFIDMTVECPINVFNIISLFHDRLHPSKTAHKMIGRWLAGMLPFRNI